MKLVDKKENSQALETGINVVLEVVAIETDLVSQVKEKEIFIKDLDYSHETIDDVSKRFSGVLNYI